MKINTVIQAHARPRIERLLKRLERASDMRGSYFSSTFGEPFLREKRGTRVYEQVQTLEVKMAELSDVWTLLYKDEPADINSRPLQDQPVIRKWNPTLNEEDWAMLTHPNDLYEDKCDHCTSGKRGRHATFTLQRKDDVTVTKTVGSSCLYEYTSIDPTDVEALLKLKGRGDYAYSGERNTRQYPMMGLADFALIAGLWAHNRLPYQKGLGTMFFRQVSCAVSVGHDKYDLGHWLAHDDGGMKFQPVIRGVTGLTQDGILESEARFTEPVVKHANAFIAYMQDLAGVNSFEQNVRNIEKSGVVTSKTANLAGGAVSGYMRAQVQASRAQARATAEANAPTSEWVGEVGKRQSFGDCTVAFTRRLENQWGSTTLTRLTDSAGNMLVWFRSGDHNDLEVGMVVSFTATVKKHDSYKEAKQTTVTRGRVD